MLTATFYQQPAIGDKTKLIEGCGDRATIIIDARLTRAYAEAIAADECKKRGYLAWQLHRGTSILNAAPISKVNQI